MRVAALRKQCGTLFLAARALRSKQGQSVFAAGKYCESLPAHHRADNFGYLLFVLYAHSTEDPNPSPYTYKKAPKLMFRGFNFSFLLNTADTAVPSQYIMRFYLPNFSHSSQIIFSISSILPSISFASAI